MNIRPLSFAAISVMLVAMGLSPSAQAIGDITCETPELSATGTMAFSAGPYSDGIAVAFDEKGELIEVVVDPGFWLDDCVTGSQTAPAAAESTEPTAR